MSANLIAYWVLAEEGTTSKGSGTAGISIVIFKIGKCVILDKFIKDMACERAKISVGAEANNVNVPLKSKEPRIVSARVIASGERAVTTR
jgi:hypothetical protein